jgi:hypothetical protein
MTTKQHQITTTANPPSLDRHARKCAVCSHKDREDIELDFLHWHNCINISTDYELHDFRTIYRHAHATGLWERRMLNLRSAVAHIVENAESCEPSANAVLKAIQACTEINEQGQWIHAPRHVIYEVAHRQVSAAELPALAAPKPSEHELESEISNRQWKGLENAATSTKH